MPHKFWDEAVATAAFLINRLDTSILKQNSPYEVLFESSPDFKFLRVFGCLCYPHLRAYATQKLDARSERCVFLGNSSMHLGYRCLSLETGKIYISPHVVFHEEIFPFLQTSHLFSKRREGYSSIYTNWYDK